MNSAILQRTKKCTRVVVEFEFNKLSLLLKKTLRNCP